MLRPNIRPILALGRSSFPQPLASTAKPLTARLVTQQRFESTSSTHQQQPPQSPSPSTTPPNTPGSKSSYNTNIYKQFGRPFAKVFLGAMFTYQVLYWGWEKMRLDEVKEDRRAEIKDLEQQVDEYKTKKGAAR